MTLEEFKSVEEALAYALEMAPNPKCERAIQHLQAEVKRKDEALRYEINFLNHLLIFGFGCEDDKKCLEQTRERIKELEQALAEQQLTGE